MLGRQVFGLRCEADSVRRDEIRQNLLVSFLLETVDFDCFPQQRVGNNVGVAQHPQTCVAFGLHRDIPDRQADQSIARLRVESGPIDNRRSVWIVRVEQHAAEGSLVRLAAENDRTAFAGFPCPGSTVGGPDFGSIQIERGSPCFDRLRHDAPCPLEQLVANTPDTSSARQNLDARRSTERTYSGTTPLASATEGSELTRI